MVRTTSRAPARVLITFVCLGVACSTPVPPPPPPDAGRAENDGGHAPLQAPDELSLVPARTSIAIDWMEVAGAEQYRLYFATQPFTAETRATASAVDDVQPGFVHTGRGTTTTYHYAVAAVRGGVEGPLSSVQTTQTTGQFELLHFGTGRIDDLLSDGQVAVPLERRIHVLLLAEGYLATDLPTFEADGAEWLRQLFALDIYDAYRAAFVVWALPAASAERVAPGAPQTADTAFAVPITADGRGVESSVPLSGATAQRVWALMDSFPCPPSRFFGPDGKTRYVAKNLVVAIMVFDTDVGRSGLSGRARRLENPSDPTQRISAAIAHNRPHEFSHAFVRLSDEYLGAAAVGLGTDNALTNQSAYATNVVAAPDCDSLPWRHLLHGGPHNPDTEQLVGAFGTAEMGYHSEFRCLMNGTHENASFYGGDGRLRTSDRFCNHCRELTAFRISEHVGILDEPATSLSTWERDHRARFYERFGFVVPDTVPQQSSDGVPHFQACAP